jgi:hypothetical protein
MGPRSSSEEPHTQPATSPSEYFLYSFIVIAIIGVVLATAVAPPLASANEDKWDGAYGNTTPSWIPPQAPPGADIEETEYAQMWAGMENINGSIADGLANNDNYSQNDAAYVIAARQDGTTTTPPEAPVEWNSEIESEFNGGGLQTSSYPPGTSTTDGEYVKDAYIRIAEPTPSTRLHTENGTIHLVRSDGGLLLSSDFRIEGPVDNSPSGVRKSYQLEGTFQTDVTVRSNGRNITNQTTDSNGAVFVTYEGIRQDQTELTVEKQYGVVYSVTVERYLCDNRNCTSRSWRITDNFETSENVTVTDSIAVERESDHGHIDVRPGDNSHHVRVRPPEYWSALEVGADQSAFVSSEIAFYTTRNTEWDTFVDSTADGVSEPYQHDFTPVQTHATPAYQGVFTSGTGGTDITLSPISQDLGPQKPYRESPRNVNISTSTGFTSYQTVNTATIRIGGLDAPPNPGQATDASRNIEYHPLVYGNVIATSQERWDRTHPTNLTVDSEPMYAHGNEEEPSHYRVTVELRDVETGEPIQTKGTSRKILINGEYEVNIDQTGRALKTFDADDRAPTGFTARFVPQHPFEGETHYEPAEDSTSTPVEYTDLGETINNIIGTIGMPLLVILLPFAVVWVIANIGLFGRIPYLGRI